MKALRNFAILFALLLYAFGQSQVNVAWYDGDPDDLWTSEFYEVIRSDSVVSFIFSSEVWGDTITKYLSFHNNGNDSLPELITCYYYFLSISDNYPPPPIILEGYLVDGIIEIGYWTSFYRTGRVNGVLSDGSTINFVFNALFEPICDPMGDLDNDNDISVADIVITIDDILANEPIDYCADLSSDMKVNIVDVVVYIDHILNE